MESLSSACNDVQRAGVLVGMTNRRMMSTVAPTALGAIGLIWSDQGIVRTWMHAGTVDRARSSMRRAYPGAAETTPPADIAAVIAEIDQLLQGARPDLRAANLDM